MPVVKIKQKNRVSCGSYLWTHSTLQRCGHLHHIIWKQNYPRFPCSNNTVLVQLEVELWPKRAKHKHLRLQAQTQNTCFNADSACGRGIWATNRNGQGYSRCRIYRLFRLSSLQSVLLHLHPYKKKKNFSYTERRNNNGQPWSCDTNNMYRDTGVFRKTAILLSALLTELC